MGLRAGLQRTVHMNAGVESRPCSSALLRAAAPCTPGPSEAGGAARACCKPCAVHHEKLVMMSPLCAAEQRLSKVRRAVIALCFAR